MRRETTAVGDEPERGLARLAADVVEDHVKNRGQAPILHLVRLDHLVGAEGADTGELVLVARGRGHVRAHRNGELGGDDPEPAAGADDEHAVAALDARAFDERDGGGTVVHERRRLLEVEHVRDLDERLRLHRHLLGVAVALAGVRGDPLADPVRVGAVTDRDHTTGNGTARHVGRGVIEHGRGLAAPDHRLDPDDVSSGDLDKRLAGTR